MSKDSRTPAIIAVQGWMMTRPKVLCGDRIVSKTEVLDSFNQWSEEPMNMNTFAVAFFRVIAGLKSRQLRRNRKRSMFYILPDLKHYEDAMRSPGANVTEAEKDAIVTSYNEWAKQNIDDEINDLL